MMVQSKAMVVGVFRDLADAERARGDLLAAGFPADRIGVLVRGEARAGAASPSRPATTDAGPGGAIGAVTGGILGALAAVLIPGLGPVLVGGAIAVALGGAAVGATAGGLVGVLIGMGIPEVQARGYEAAVRGGRALVTVQAGGREAEATEILRRDGGEVDGPSALNNPANITDTVESTAERYPPLTQPIEATRSIPEAGVGPNLEGDDEPVTPNEVSER